MASVMQQRSSAGQTAQRWPPFVDDDVLSFESHSWILKSNSVHLKTRHEGNQTKIQHILIANQI